MTGHFTSFTECSTNCLQYIVHEIFLIRVGSTSVDCITEFWSFGHCCMMSMVLNPQT